MITEENIIRVPPDVGLTGKAVVAKESMAFMNCSELGLYSSDIDNIRHISIKNLLVVPFFTKRNGVEHLSGVLQLVNKTSKEPIAQQDIVEASAIGPALAMVLDLCDAHRGLTGVLATL
jgi:hypothetical protein